MKSYERALEIRHNNGFDSLLLVEDRSVIGEWTLTPERYKDFIDHGDLSDWDRTNVSDDATDPELYGELVSRITQRREYSDGWDWSGYYPQKKQELT